MSKEQIDELNTHLALVKKSPADKIEEDFYSFMVKAKDTLGQQNYHMAKYNYEYADFFLQKFEKNIDIFNDQALPKNVADDANNLINDIPDQFDDSSEPVPLDEAEQIPEAPEAEQNGEQAPEQAQNADPDQPEIVGDEQAGNQEEKANQEEDADDKEICLLNLLQSEKFCEKELEKIKNGESDIPYEEVYGDLRRTYTRIADFYLMEENYEKSTEYYQKIIDQQQKREGFQHSRFVSQIHILKAANLLNQVSKANELKAIQQYFKAVNKLLCHLSVDLNHDSSEFPIPNLEITTIPRMHYMTHAGDDDKVKDVKQILGMVLDKIEDTKHQHDTRAQYNAEKEKIKSENNKKDEFKPVSEETKVVHLGKFGNRKKKNEEQNSEYVQSEAIKALSEKIQQQHISESGSKTVPKSQDTS